MLRGSTWLPFPWIRIFLPLALGAAALPAAAQTRLLVFSGWVGFRHETLPDGIAAVRALGAARGWVVDASEDPAVFTDANLLRYDVLVWNNNCGIDDSREVLTAAQKSAFERFLQSGKGTVGIHCASCLGNAGPGTWTFFNEMIGAVNVGHPMGALQFQTARLNIEKRDHPATRGLPAAWSLREEWYDYDRSPRADVTVLLSLDEKSYQPGKVMGDHPIAWCRTFRGGRVFYTGLGHLKEVFLDTNFRGHLAGGIQWAAGLSDPSVTVLRGRDTRDPDRGALRRVWLPATLFQGHDLRGRKDR